ncbi:hypothetical protein MTR67_034424 [Solanum verrucosum]|uniref:Tf2-1-like SH3-like domain-containing protein n=1 Tax=Solanum verrucosum TaxID=315347 RepID=A0AAF0U8I6_SOLVR|nr:hypothetical protein MTR67_034424 [Solanum verrucosum]
MKGVMSFGKKGKLSPRYVGPNKILKRVGKVPYELDLPTKLALVHPNGLTFEEVPVDILDRQDQRLRSKEVASVIVLWRRQSIEGTTWEAEARMKAKYPHLLHSYSIPALVGLRLNRHRPCKPNMEIGVTLTDKGCPTCLWHEYCLKMHMKNGKFIYGGLKVVLSGNGSKGCHSYIAQAKSRAKREVNIKSKGQGPRELGEGHGKGAKDEKLCLDTAHHDYEGLHDPWWSPQSHGAIRGTMGTTTGRGAPDGS